MKKIITQILRKYFSKPDSAASLQRNIIRPKTVISITVMSMAVLFSGSVLAQSTFNVVNGNWDVATNWTPNGVPTGATGVDIPTGYTANMVSGDSYTGSGAINLSGTLSVPNGASFESTGMVYIGNGSTLSGGGMVNLSTLIVDGNPSLTNFTTVPLTMGIGNATGTLNLTFGFLNASGQTIVFPKAGIINATGGNFANSADGLGDNNAAGGTIICGTSAPATMSITGSPVLYNVYVSNGNTAFALPSSGNATINGTFTVANNGNQFSATGNAPIWGSLSSFYYDGGGQNSITHTANLWSAANGTIGVTPGYANNVTITNLGTSAGGNYGWNASSANSIAGVFTIGGIGGATNGQINFGNATSFSCSGFVLESGSKFNAPLTMTVAGSWIDSSSNNFINNSGTVVLDGASFCNIPDYIQTTNSSETFYNLTLNGGTYVSLQSPVTVTNTFTLTSGTLLTSGTNVLDVTNTATNAITGMGIGAGSEINGPVEWSLSATAGTYLFPVSAGSDNPCPQLYLPLTLNKTATNAATIVTVQAFAHGSGGTTDGTLSSLSNNEYWSLSTSSSLTGSTISLATPTAIAPLAYIGESTTTSNGVYTSIGGDAVADGINNSNDIGSNTSLFFTLGVPPIVSTLAATSITTTGATLNGSFNTQGTSLTTSFNYGLTTAYGSIIATIHSPINSTSSTADSVIITGLTANTLYDYLATDGVNSGNNVVFITAPNPPTVGTPSNSTMDGFTANWSAPAIPGTAPYTYTVEVSSDPTFTIGVTTQTSIPSGTTSYTFTTLASATNYYYRVEAVNATANSVWSSTSLGISTGIVPTPPCTTGSGSTTSTGSIVKARTLPIIDGQVDPIWDSIPANNISYVSVGTNSGNTQTWKAMWSTDSLYFLFQVNDNTLLSQQVPDMPAGANGIFGTAVTVPGVPSGTSGNYYDYDGVEVTLAPDGNTTNTGYNGYNDVQFRFNLGATNVSGESSGTATQFSGAIFQSVYQHIDFKVITTPTGYNVEAAIPLDPGIDSVQTGGYFLPQNGQPFGLEVQVNDATSAANARVTQYSWYNGSSAAYYNPSTFAAATLTSCPVPPTVILPTVTNITDSSAVLGATVSSSGDNTLISNGTGYTASPDNSGSGNALAAGTVVTPSAAYTTPRSGLTPQTKYYFLGYAQNADTATGISTVDSFYTLSALPLSQPILSTSTCAGVTLNWTAITFPATDSATQTGYLILRRQDGTNPTSTGISTRIATTQSSLPAGTTLVATISSGATHTYIDATASAEVAYNYLLIPFTWDGTITDSTYNYDTTNASSISAVAGAALLAPTATATQPTCALATGSITITAPTSGVTYSYNNGVSYTSSADTSGLAPGTYNVLVQTTAGCVSPDTAITISPAPGAPAKPTVTAIQPTCTIPTGTITVTAPTTGVLYSYNNGASYTSSADTSGLAPGTYLVLVQTTAGCVSADTSVTITSAPGTPTTPTVVATQPTCTTTTGAIAVSVPASGVLYSFNDGSSYTTSTDTSGLVPGNYEVVVQTTAGCTSSDTVVTINAVPAPPVVTISANPTGTVSPGTTVTLSGNSSITGTYLWSTSTTPPPNLTTVNDSTITTEPQISSNYLLTVTTAAGCTGSQTDSITVNTQTCSVIPSKAFTPNNDGKNDKWIVYSGGCTLNIEVSVYNRWGGLVYNSTSYQNDWEGTYKGNPLPDGTYYYVIVSTDSSGAPVTITGNVTIMR